jgi:hypothetical protein
MAADDDRDAATDLDTALDEAFDALDAYRARHATLDESIEAMKRDARTLWGTAPTIEPSLPAPPPRKPTVAERVRAVFARPRPVRPLLRRPVPPLHQRISPRRRQPTPHAPPPPAPWERRGSGKKEEVVMTVCENGHLLMPGDKFCRQCGTSVARTCRTCGQLLPAARAAAARRAAEVRAEEESDGEEPFEKARGAMLDQAYAAATVLPGVADIGGDELLLKATIADRGADRLSTLDVARLESYAGNGLSLHQIAAADPQLALKVYRAVTPAVA